MSGLTEGQEKRWSINHPRFDAMFNAALTGICANPHFFGSTMQQDPRSALDFAEAVVHEAHRRALQHTGEA